MSPLRQMPKSAFVVEFMGAVIRVARGAAPALIGVLITGNAAWFEILGLAAIPLLLIHSFVQGRANALITTLDETAAELFAEGRTHREAAHAG